MLTRAPHHHTVLAVESDHHVRSAITQVLKHEGYQVIEATEARTALRLARECRPDVIITDAALPDMTGLELCTRLRAMPFVNVVPILFLSVNASAQYAAQVLDSGGDDFLRKPFAIKEFNARVRALLRRSPNQNQAKTQPTLRLQEAQYQVWVNNRQVELTPTEYSLLEYLCKHPDEHLTAELLLQKIWNYPPGGGDKALVRNHIRNLRRKIEDNPDYPTIVISMHGRGYSVNARLD